MLQLFGTIQAPGWISNPQASGLITLISNIVKLLLSFGGLYVFFNIIMAGYQFISGGGDSKAISSAWAKIYQSLMGLAIIAASLLITSVASLIIFGDSTFILNPRIYGP
jgi:hypothetical protein